MKIEFTDPGGSDNVISLKAKRDSVLSRIAEKAVCRHVHVEFDTAHTTLDCADCKRQLNPIEYLASLVEHWDYVKRLYEQYREAKVAYEAKKRCRCEHCGKLTAVKPATAAEIRKFRETPRQDEGKSL